MATCSLCHKSGAFLKVNSLGLCDVCSANELNRLSLQIQELSSPEYKDLSNIRNKIAQAQQQLSTITSQISVKQQEYKSLLNSEKEKQNQLVQLDDRILLESFCLYKPTFNFATSTQYKERIDFIRQQESAMIKSNLAVTGNTNWSVNGSQSEGKKMVTNMQKLLLRSFNCECDDAVSKVKYNNYDISYKRITKSAEQVSKLGESMGIVISQQYYNFKIEELKLALEYEIKKQTEKEEIKKKREEMREQEKLEKEIKAAREKIEKERKHFNIALLDLNKRLISATDEEKIDITNKISELNASVDDLNKQSADIDYREKNAKAGYVYIISNIGSFGENIYKIGMTRRLEPLDRIDELGDASVPFNFDVHALIFSDDAPALEAALHKAFENKKLNMVNQRREFFNVTLKEIEDVVKQNFDKTVDFIEVPEASQYRESIALKQ